MDKFTYKNFQLGNTDIAYDANKGYTEPTSEAMVRKELSYPLYEVKKYINEELLDGTDNDAHIKVGIIPEATDSTNGLMSASDKDKLDGIESGAEVNIIEDVKVNGTSLTVTSKSVNIPEATTSAPGVMSASDKTKLNGLNNALANKADFSKVGTIRQTVGGETDFHDIDNYEFIVDGDANIEGLRVNYADGDDERTFDIPKVPCVSSADNGKILKVVGGEWNVASESGGGSNVWTASYSNNGIYSASTLTTNEGDFVLSPGNKVIVTFTNVDGCEISSYSKLNVDGTGALSIRNLDGKVPSSGYQYQYSGVKDANIIAKDTTATFTYDGTYLVVDRYSPATPTEFGLTINNNGFGYALVTPNDIDPLDPTWMVKLTSASGVDMTLSDPSINMHIPYVDVKMFTYTETDGAYEYTPFTNFTYKINEPSIMPVDTGDVDLVITFGSAPVTNVVICVHGNFTDFDFSYV